MASAEIGGDSSVEWEIKADHIRAKHPPTSKPDKEEGRRWRQHGIDETGFGAKSGFFITLKLPTDPRNRTMFVTTLWQACADALANINKSKTDVQFTLPIEPKSRNQIRIEWNARKLPKRKSGRKRKP